MSQDHEDVAHVEKPRRWAFPGHGAALAGVMFAILFVIGFTLLDPVRGLTPTDAATALQGSVGTGVLAAGYYIVPASGICFLWFIAATRHRLGALAQREHLVFSTVQMLSGVLFVAIIFIATAAAMVGVAGTRVTVANLDTVLGQTLGMVALSETLLMVFGFRAAAVFIMATTTRAVRAGLFPKWFGILSAITAGVLFVAVSYQQWMVLVFPAWMLVCSLFVMFRRVMTVREEA